MKQKIRYSLPYAEFNDKYQNSPIKPGVFFYRIFLDLLHPKFQGPGQVKRDMLLYQLLQNKVLIPDTLISFRDVEVHTRVHFDPKVSNYVITQGEHVTSSFYNSRRRQILELTGQLGSPEDQDHGLNNKPMAIEKNMAETNIHKPDFIKVLNSENLKQRALKDFGGDMII